MSLTDSMTRSDVSQCLYIHFPPMKRRPCSKTRKNPVAFYCICRLCQHWSGLYIHLPPMKRRPCSNARKTPSLSTLSAGCVDIGQVVS